MQMSVGTHLSAFVVPIGTADTSLSYRQASTVLGAKRPSRLREQWQRKEIGGEVIGVVES